MPVFRFHLCDRKTGEVFDRDKIEARNKTEARKLLAQYARREVPQGRHGARDLGFIPFRDWQIIWQDDGERY